MAGLTNADTKSTSPVIPKYPNIRTELRNTPTRLLNITLKIAEASSPLADTVRTQSILILSGRHAHIIIPFAKSSDKTPSANVILVKPNMNAETTPKLKF